MNINEIRNIRFAGNFANDEDNFKNIHSFVMNTMNPMSERIEALRIWYHQGMGFLDRSVDEREVKQYVEENSEIS